MIIVKSIAAIAGLSLVVGSVSHTTSRAASRGRSWEEQTPVERGRLVEPLRAGLGSSPYEQVGPGPYMHVPHYHRPDGGYDSLVDLSREVNGVPCGIGCQARALRRWGYLPPR